MKILHISDTHGFHGMMPDERFKDIDIVVHSGDCANYRDPYRNQAEVLNFLEWYKNGPVEHKIYVAGNHDSSVERRLVTPEFIREQGIIYLENESVAIDGINFYGSPYTPTFGMWSFMKSRDKMHKVWQAVPEDTHVLIVHGPPKGVRDLSFNRDGNLEMCGDVSLMKRCFALKDTLKAVCFGHIHNMDGVDSNQGTSIYSNMPNTIFSNAACVYDGKFDRGLTSHGNIIKL
jgi:predicted phosphodiesterase